MTAGFYQKGCTCAKGRWNPDCKMHPAALVGWAKLEPIVDRDTGDEHPEAA